MTKTGEDNGPGESLEASGQLLREVMRDVPSPVAIVTAAAPESRFGITIGSIASASLDPPLITFNVTVGTPIVDALSAGSRCIVHLLSTHDIALADHFAEPVSDGRSQFDGIPVLESVDGVPLVAATGAVLIGTVAETIGVGDHVLFVTQIDRILPGTAPDGLAYFQSGYHSVDGHASRATVD